MDEIRLSTKLLVILRLLDAYGGEMGGKELSEKSCGMVKYVGIYQKLMELGELGLVESREEKPRIPERGFLPRRLYKLTALGKSEVAKRKLPTEVS